MKKITLASKERRNQSEAGGLKVNDLLGIGSARTDHRCLSFTVGDKKEVRCKTANTEMTLDAVDEGTRGYKDDAEVLA